MVGNSTDRFNGYVSNLAIKAPCVAATAVNITLEGEQTVNGIAIVATDRVLVKDQTDPIENGIYVARDGLWERAPDFDGNRDVATRSLTVVGATGGATEIYLVAGDEPYRIGVDEISFVELSLGGGGGWSDGDSAHYLTDLLLSGAAPFLELYETDAGLDEKGWRLVATGGDLYFRTYNDADDATDNIFRVVRTGNVIDRLDFLTTVNMYDNVLQRAVLADTAHQKQDHTTAGTSQTLQYFQGPVFDVDFGSTTGSPVSMIINSGPPSGRYGEIIVRVQQHASSARTIAWSFDTFRHAGGVAHPLNSTLSGYSIYKLKTFDSGASWEVSGADYS